ncbi:MAG TPA: PqiC family protein [Acetobacteraceae bacterium]|nr:PqiC family protein [Acetobacteraceae bacterium]
MKKPSPGMPIGRRGALWLLAGLPAACASPNPILYTLAIVPGATHPVAPPRIELREIAVAHYLERSQIVRSSEDFRLDVLGNDWWGEQLDAMLSRVLVQELSQRLPSSTVFAENGAITATPDAAVELNVQRFDEDRSGALVLLAQVAVTGRVTAMRNVRFSVPPPSPGTVGLVSAMSIAVGQLADAIAESVTTHASRG